jgi:ABC-type transport system involved in multi-copper enzyme maturation permease subunit
VTFWMRSAWKETLAIGPIWLASCLVIAAAPLFAAVGLAFVPVIAYVLGAVATGAHVFGHEYGHRTLTSLLALPIERRTIAAIKLVVLLVALLALTGVASIGPYAPLARFPMQSSMDTRVLYLPCLLGLTLAPYLTLVSRSTLGGAVFSIGIPGLLLVVIDLIGVSTFGMARPGDIDRLKGEVLPVATLAACAFAFIALWHRFSRLEVLGDSAGHVTWVSAQPSRAGELRRAMHDPIRLLVAKELRLQQMVFVVAAFYVVGAASLWWFSRPDEYSLPVPWLPLNMMYGSIVAVLIGALASAEERQFGTLEWQTLLPVSRVKQFVVKIAVVLGLTIAFSAVLPAAVSFALVTPYRAAFPEYFFGWMCITASGCALGALYVSSVTSSGVKAMAVGLPFVAAAFMLLRATDMSVGYAIWNGWLDRSWLLVRRPTPSQAQLIGALILAWLAVVAVTLAHRNHWAAGRSAASIARQTAAITATIVIAGVAMALFRL